MTGRPTRRSVTANDKLVLALPKGRILKAITPLLTRAGIEPEDAFFDEDSRQLQFATRDPQLDIIRVRSFDTATFLAFGAAHLGVSGSDVLMGFDHPEIYAPVDLHVGHCHLAVAAPAAGARSADPQRWSHLRVATQYPNVTRRYSAARGVQAECIKLTGALKPAPNRGLCRRHRKIPMLGSSVSVRGSLVG